MMMGIIRWIGVALALFAITASAALGNYYEIGNPQTYEVRQVLELRNRGGVANDVRGRVHIFDREELPPYQKLLSCSVYASSYKPKLYKDYAEWVIPKMLPNQTVKIEFEYWIVNYTIDHQLKEFRGRTRDADKYLMAETGIESADSAIVALANRLTADQSTPLAKAKSIYAFVNSHMDYHIVEDEKDHSALKALNRKYGSCVDFSLAYIALCRAAGIPARYVSGYRFDEMKISHKSQVLTPYSHAWVEIQLPQLGWVTVDPTYVYTVAGVKMTNYNYFGKIIPGDRHLFFNYRRDRETEVQWRHDKRSPAKLEMNMTMTIRRVR